MSGKGKNSDVKVLKGQEAEDKVLEYVKRMNRPYGAVDVSANLKGVVPKTATQKILMALAERGELVQKTYGKTTFFVANQANIDAMPAEKLAALEAEYKVIEEDNKVRAAEVKALCTELSRLKASPTDEELNNRVAETSTAISQITVRLKSLRGGTAVISAQELAQVEADWLRWRSEWVRRRKVFTTFWELATDALPPQDATNLAEDLGIEFDTPEHTSVERGPLCAIQNTSRPSMKRKREPDS